MLATACKVVAEGQDLCSGVEEGAHALQSSRGIVRGKVLEVGCAGLLQAARKILLSCTEEPGFNFSEYCDPCECTLSKQGLLYSDWIVLASCRRQGSSLLRAKHLV